MEIKVQLTDHPKAKTPDSELGFGRVFTDHMFTMDWDKENGWHDAYDELHEGKEFGYTAHAFKGDDRPYKPTHGRIDYIMTKGGAKARSCEVLKDRPRGIWPSDHYFMLAEIVVE